MSEIFCIEGNHASETLVSVYMSPIYTISLHTMSQCSFIAHFILLLVFENLLRMISNLYHLTQRLIATGRRICFYFVYEGCAYFILMLGHTFYAVYLFAVLLKFDITHVVCTNFFHSIYLNFYYVNYYAYHIR